MEAALEMERNGADIIDIGGESTRPGAAYVSLDEELERVVPAVEELRKRSGVVISVDTRKSAVAAAAVGAGADIINDISALEDDPETVVLAARENKYLILMHKQGRPDTMQINPSYEDTVSEIRDYLLSRAEAAMTAGVPRDRIILDPGIGFGKRQEDNLAILKNIDVFKETGFPLLIALSRKSFIGNILGNDPEERLAGTLAANLFSLVHGADIVRVHDVKETSDTLKIAKELTWIG